MNQSESIAKLAPALVAAQGGMGAAKKSAKNPHLKNKYADLASVWEAVADGLNTNGLAIVQGVSGDTGCITVTTRLLHASGEWIEDSLSLPYVGNKGINDAQAAGSAITYARRYGLSAILSLPTEDDGGSGSGAPRAAPPKTITDDQLMNIMDMVLSTQTDEEQFCEFLTVDKLENLLASNFGHAMAALKQKAKRLADEDN